MIYRCLVILAFAFLATQVAAQRPQPFEGIITYVIKTELKEDSSKVNKHYAQKYGDTLTVYHHRNGSERREYHNTGSYGFDYHIYNKINNEEYTKWKDLPYVIYSSSADTSSRLSSIVFGDTLSVLEEACESLAAVSIDLKNGDTLRQTLYFSGNQPILPHTYLNRKTGHFDKLYNQSKSLFLRKELDIKHAKYTFTAVSIKKMKVDANLFIIPKGLTKNKKMF